MDINYLFLAVVALFLYMTIRGYRKGFLQIVVTFLGMIVILAAVKRMSPYISEYLIHNTSTYESVQGKITERFSEANQKYDNSIKENQELTIKSYEIPDMFKDELSINNTTEMYKKLLVTAFEDYVSAYLARIIIKAVSFVALFIILYLIFKVLLGIVNLISKIPIIKGLNRMAGACLGIIESLIVVWLFFIIIVVFVGNKSGSVLFTMISNSRFLTYLFNSNVFISILS